MPQGLLEIVTGDGSTGAALIEARVDKIMFTGSVATGKRVAEAAAKHLTPVVLELGGKDPMVVLEDADIENAARGAVWGLSQIPVRPVPQSSAVTCTNRLRRSFSRACWRRQQALRQDVGTKEDTDVGAMTNERQLQIVEEHVADAVERGAKVVTGGKRSTT